MTRIVTLGLVIVLSCPVLAMAANDLAAIHGQVQDSTGGPLVGALVIVAPSSPLIPERIAFTDRRGSFSVLNLFAGDYSVKVTMPRFLPALKPGIRLNSGGSVILTVNLQNAMDIVRRATTRDKAQADDIVWTLRSSRSTQPVLRLVRDVPEEDQSSKTSHPASYSGYFQVYSKSVETSSGSTESVGSHFSVTMPLDNKSKVTFAGQYSEAPLQPKGFGATYDFVPTERHKSTLGVNVKEGAFLGDPLRLDSMREVQVKYGEDFQWSDHFVFTYGAELGRSQSLHQNYLRPRVGISWVPVARTTVSVVNSSQEPAAADDPIRGKEYFDRPVYVSPALERYSHTEASLNHFFSENTEFSAAVFRDVTDIQALFVGAPSKRYGVLILDTRHNPSQGVRVHLNRRFRNFEAGIGYTSASGVGFSSSASDPHEMRNHLERRRFQVVAARFKADLDATNTEITAVYRWVSAVSASRIDPYQRLMEYNDPTLSLSIAQDLPAFRMFPAKLQAIVDARNLFEPSFGSQRPQVAQYPRLVKGGINIKF